MCCNAIITIPENVPNGISMALKSEETLLKCVSVELLAAGVEKSFSTLLKFNIYHETVLITIASININVLHFVQMNPSKFAKLFDEFAFPF